MASNRYYKFVKINKNLIDSLVKSYIYCSKPEKLNDPFDCKLDLKKAINKSIDNVAEAVKNKLVILLDNVEFFNDVQIKIDNSGIASFAYELRPDNETLLWSHYADNHRGACLLYEIPEEFILNTNNNIVGTAPVTYDDNPLTNLIMGFANDTRDVTKIILKEFLDSIIKLNFTSKSPPWSYENEIRIIRDDHGRLEISKSFLKQVCFGLHATDNDIELIKEIVLGYENTVHLCRIIRVENDFGIDIKNMNDVD